MSFPEDYSQVYISDGVNERCDKLDKLSPGNRVDQMRYDYA